MATTIKKAIVANGLKVKYLPYTESGSAGTDLLGTAAITGFTIDGVSFEQIDITAITDEGMYKTFVGGVGDPGKVSIDMLLQDGQKPPVPPAPANAIVYTPAGKLQIYKPDGTSLIFECDANLSETGKASVTGKTTITTGVGFQLCGEPKFFGTVTP